MTSTLLRIIQTQVLTVLTFTLVLTKKAAE